MISLIDEECREGFRSILGVAPTGFGKTEVSVEYLRRAQEKNIPAWFVAPRVSLVDQTVKRLHGYGLYPGVIQANNPRVDYNKLLQIVSKDTICNRLSKVRHKPGLIIVDEAHDGTFGKPLVTLRELYGDALWIWLTATPGRGDGKGLGRFCDVMVEPTSINELIHEGWLLPYRAYKLDAPDTSNVDITAGDYNIKQLAEVSDTFEMNGNAVRDYLLYGQGRRSIAFCTNIEHSRHLAQTFNDAGIPFMSVDSASDSASLDKALNLIRQDKIKGISSVGMLTTGFDEPSIMHGIMLRKTKSYELYLQMMGRVIRPPNGRNNCNDYATFQDHADLINTHGHITDDTRWTLEDRPKIVLEDRQGYFCPVCGEEFRSWPLMCPSCGEPFREKNPVEHRIPVENDRQLIEDSPVLKDFDRKSYYSHLVRRALAEDKPARWVTTLFNVKYGEYPKVGDAKLSLMYTKFHGPSGDSSIKFFDHSNKEMPIEDMYSFNFQKGVDNFSNRVHLVWEARDQIKNGCGLSDVAERQYIKCSAFNIPDNVAREIKRLILAKDFTGTITKQNPVQEELFK